jgi:hypothetical protein
VQYSTLVHGYTGTCVVQLYRISTGLQGSRSSTGVHEKYRGTGVVQWLCRGKVVVQWYWYSTRI